MKKKIEPESSRQSKSLFDSNGKMTGKPLSDYRDSAPTDDLTLSRTPDDQLTPTQRLVKEIRSGRNITAEDLNTVVGPAWRY